MADGSVVNNVPDEYIWKVQMEYKSGAENMIAVFPDVETACDASELAVKYKHGGYQQVFLAPAPMLDVTHDMGL